MLHVFTKPDSLSPIVDVKGIEGGVMYYQNSDIAQAVSAELLFGAMEAQGKLRLSLIHI